MDIVMEAVTCTLPGLLLVPSDKQKRMTRQTNKHCYAHECEEEGCQLCMSNQKLAIHYSRTWANMTSRGTKLFFRRIKYCWQKWDERVAVYCSLFAVNFSAADYFFFDEKVLCVCRRDCYPDANLAYSVRRKTCLWNMVNAFYRLFAVRRFLSFHPYFAVVRE